MITAQWATGKCGGRYRYYRCTKKKGVCSQGYVREEILADQIKERLQTISLCDVWTTYMLKCVDEMEKEESSASQSVAENLSTKLKASEEKLDRLVSAFIDGDIPKDIYLAKKDKLMRESLALKQERKDFRHHGKNWVEPLRDWILDTKQAAFLSSSSNFDEIASFVKKVGTNPTVRDKSARFGAPVPSDFVAKLRESGRLSQNPNPAHFARRSRASALTREEVSICDPTENRRSSLSIFLLSQKITKWLLPWLAGPEGPRLRLSILRGVYERQQPGRLRVPGWPYHDPTENRTPISRMKT